jgi:hypothetical protein
MLAIVVLHTLASGSALARNSVYFGFVVGGPLYWPGYYPAPYYYYYPPVVTVPSTPPSTSRGMMTMQLRNRSRNPTGVLLSRIEDLLSLCQTLSGRLVAGITAAAFTAVRSLAMIHLLRFSPLLLAPLLLVGCVTVPEGPSVFALPGAGKSFSEFRADDAECRQYAWMQIGGNSPALAAQNSAVASAVLGTVVGTAAGAAIGGRSGAAVGAGSGLLVGSLAGTGAAQGSAYTAQRRYDHAYVQCMYAKGDRVPVFGHLMSSRSMSYYPPPPPAPR